MEIEKKQAHHESICKSLTETYVKKNIDYGDSFTDGIDKFGLVSAATRLNDKNNRIGQLITSDKQNVKDESLKDSLLDMANYCIMTVMHMDGEGVELIGKPVIKPDDLQDVLSSHIKEMKLADLGYYKIDVSTKFEKRDIIVFEPYIFDNRVFSDGQLYYFDDIFKSGLGYIVETKLDYKLRGKSYDFKLDDLVNDEYYIRKGV